MTHHRWGAPRGRTRVDLEAEGEGKNVVKSLCCGFCGKKWLRQAPGWWYQSGDTSSLLRLSEVGIVPLSDLAVPAWVI